VSRERVAQIRTLLEREMAPETLEVIDESHLHVGHPGARDGRGHFRIRITSDRLAGHDRLARHRMIYRALGDMMNTDIHALTIEAYSGNE
jgi:BolA family transcriptional regulator, general stress-responsive regulator